MDRVLTRSTRLMMVLQFILKPNNCMKKNATIAFFGFLWILCILSMDARSQTGISGTWATASSTGFPPGFWFTSSAVNGKIYVIGGVKKGGPLNTLEAFDPSTNTWSTPITTGTFTARYGLASCVVNNKIYVLGGATTDDKHLLNTLEVFDPSTNTWSTPKTTGTSTTRYVLAAHAVNGKIYAIGGWNGRTDVNTLEVFDPSTNTWSTPKTTGEFTATGAFASGVVNGKIYVIGGINSTDTSAALLNTVQVFDPLTNTWNTPTTTGTITPRWALCSGVVNGKIYVMGGADTNSALNTVEVFDPSANTWSTAKTTGTFTPRNWVTSSVVDGKIYVMGGMANRKILDINEVFTPAHED